MSNTEPDAICTSIVVACGFQRQAQGLDFERISGPARKRLAAGPTLKRHTTITHATALLYCLTLDVDKPS